MWARPWLTLCQLPQTNAVLKLYMGSMADAALGLIASHKNAWMANALSDPNITAKPAGSPNNAPLRAAKPSAGPPTQRASNA